MQAMPVAPLGVGISGRGPAGQPMRVPAASVGVGSSSVPYGPTNGYATPNGVTGFIGPAAGSLLPPAVCYVRTTGADTNGGSDTSASPSQTGSGGTQATNSKSVTLTGASLTPANVGNFVRVLAGGVTGYYRIISVTSSTTFVTNINGFNGSGITSWSIGGAWATPGPALGLSSLTAGDTVYLGAGTYRSVYSANTQVSFNGQLNIFGDVTGQYTGDAGMVQLTAYTTNDKTAPSSTTLLNLNGKSNLSFSNIMFVVGNAIGITATTATSQNISFRDCSFLDGYQGNTAIITATTAQAASFAWTIDRCYFFCGAGASGSNILFTAPTVATGDYSLNVNITNSLVMMGGSARMIGFAPTGALSGHPGGIKINNSFFYGMSSAFTITAAGASTNLPCSIYNSVVYSMSNTSLSANQANTLIENYNLFVSSASRSNVSAGANTIADGSYAPLFHFGQ